MARRACDLTQAEAAVACEVDLKFYQDVEYGRRAVTTRTLFAIALGLGTSVAMIVPDAAARRYTAMSSTDAAPEATSTLTASPHLRSGK